MPHFAKISECLIQAQNNVIDLGLNTLPNFQVVHFRNDPSYIVVDHVSGLCMDLESHEVRVFDFADDMAIVEPESFTYNPFSYFNLDDFNFAVSQFKRKLNEIEVNPDEILTSKPLEVLEFYPCDPSKDQIQEIIEYFQYHKRPETIEVLAENGRDENGYFDLLHTESIELKDRIIQLQSVYKAKLVTVKRTNREFISVEEDQAHNAKAKVNYKIIADQQIFDSISNDDLLYEIQGQNPLNFIYQDKAIKNALSAVSSPRAEDVIDKRNENEFNYGEVDFL